MHSDEDLHKDKKVVFVVVMVVVVVVVVVVVFVVVIIVVIIAVVVIRVARAELGTETHCIKYESNKFSSSSSIQWNQIPPWDCKTNDFKNNVKRNVL